MFASETLFIRNYKQKILLTIEATKGIILRGIASERCEIRFINGVSTLMVASHTNFYQMKADEKKLVVNSFIQEATPDQLIKFNTNAIARYEQQSLQVIDDYFHLTDASNPIECIGQMQDVFLASKQYKSLKKKQKFNLHVTLKELILMLNKSQELFNLKQSSEDFVEILTTKIN